MNKYKKLIKARLKANAEVSIKAGQLWTNAKGQDLYIEKISADRVHASLLSDSEKKMSIPVALFQQYVSENRVTLKEEAGEVDNYALRDLFPRPE